MTTFIDETITAFGGADAVMVVSQHVDDMHFGNGQLKLIFKSLLVVMTKDRGDISADVGISGKKSGFFRKTDVLEDINIVARKMEYKRTNELNSASRIVAFIVNNYESIENTLRAR